MSATTTPETIVEPAVVGFLKKHGAEAAFHTVRELVRTCFPEFCSIEVRLIDDPDEEDCRWVVFHVFLPASHAADQLQVQRLRYYEELVSRLQFHDSRLFGLILDFMPE